MHSGKAAVLLFLLATLSAGAPERAKPTAAKPRTPPVRRAERPSAERLQIQRWMNAMTLRDLAAQLVVISSYGEAPSSRSKAFRDFVKLVRDLRVGGIIVVNRVVNGSVRSAEPFAMASFLNRMQRLARVPLIAAADFERGASMRVANTVKYPHLMAYGAAGDPSLTRELGAATAREARALGIHWVFAPVADVNNNPDNPIINIRSFGEDPKQVSAQVRAFIEGAQNGPKRRVLVTAKHFPGHGDTNIDSHIGLASLGADRARMDSLELAPFREAIAGGVDAVMTAHMAVPAVEKEEIPATVSERVLTGLLRQELGFRGLIVTDAMDMQGLTRQFPAGEASVRALEAGADVLLMPPNPEEAVRAIVAAVKQGRLTRKRIEESATKILSAKYRVGLHKSKLVNPDEISDELDSEQSAASAQAAADRAITLVKNRESLLPLKDPAGACVHVLTESRGGQQGRAFVEEFRRRAPSARIATFDPQVSMIEMEQALERSNGCSVHVVAAFVSVSAYRGNVALAGRYPEFVQKLAGGGVPVAVISLGSPYLIRAFPGVDVFATTYSPVPTAEIAAVKALLGEIPFAGKLPVTIPGIAQIGQSIRP